MITEGFHAGSAMTEKIIRHLRALLAQKATQAQQETGTARSTGNTWAISQVSRYDVPFSQV